MGSNNDWETVRRLFARLIGAPMQSFPSQGYDAGAPAERGVYIIYEGDEILHGGQTPRGKHGIDQRLADHLRGQSSFMRDYMEGDTQRLRRCNFRCLPILSTRMRWFVEAYATGVLCPAHPREEQADTAQPDDS